MNAVDDVEELLHDGHLLEHELDLPVNILEHEAHFRVLHIMSDISYWGQVSDCPEIFAVILMLEVCLKMLKYNARKFLTYL